MVDMLSPPMKVESPGHYPIQSQSPSMNNPGMPQFPGMPQGHGMPQSWQQNQMGMSGGNFRPGMMQQRFGPGGMGGIPPNM